MKIIIPIQSFSDIITNSSSEVFCRITSESQLEEIFKFLLKFFRDDGYSDEYPSMYYREKNEDYDSEYYKDYPNYWIELELPYSYEDAESFYKAGIEAILKENFTDYKIIYDE